MLHHHRTRSERVAFSYLYGFRRSVPLMAGLGSVAAWYADWPGLAAALLTIAIGELLETTYYINVLRWAEQSGPRATVDTQPCPPPWKPTG